MIPRRQTGRSWGQIPGAEVTLGAAGANYFSALEAAIQALTGCEDLSIGNPHGDTWRTDAVADVLMKTEHSLAMPAKDCDRGGTCLLPWRWEGNVPPNYPAGLSEQQLHDDIFDGLDWLENQIGIRPTTGSWPDGVSTRRTSRLLRGQGVLCYRTLWPHATESEPIAGWMLGAAYDHVDWIRNWAKWTPYNLCPPLHTGANEFHKAAKYTNHKTDGTRSMDDLLNHTATWNTNNAAYAVKLYGAYTDLISQWINYHTWVQLYSHGYSAEPDPDTLQWFFELLIADGNFWISDAKTIATATHAVHEQSADDMIYTPTSGNEAADGSGAITAWDGKAAAATFNVDTERGPEALAFADAMLALTPPCRMSASVEIDDCISGVDLTIAQLAELFGKGNVDIGLHSYSGLSLLPRISVSVKNAGAAKRAVGIMDDGGTMKLRVYWPTSQNWYDDIAALDNFGGISVVEDLDHLADGDPIDRWTESYGTVGLQGTNTGANRPILKKRICNGHSVLRTALASAQGLGYGDAADLFSNTAGRGLTVFVLAAERSGLTGDRLISKWRSADNDREWAIGSTYFFMSEDGTGTGQSAAATGYSADTDFHVGILTWIPGEAPRFFRDGAITPHATGNNTIDTISSGDSDLCLGYMYGGSSPGDFDVLCWGHLSQGYVAGDAALRTIVHSLKDKYGLA